jgi:hypothetical protein
MSASAANTKTFLSSSWDVVLTACAVRLAQCTRGLRHELSSLAQTLRFWGGIPLKAWISAFIMCFCIALCVGSGLVTGSFPVQGVLPTRYRIRKLKMLPRSSKRTVESWMNGWMDGWMDGLWFRMQYLLQDTVNLYSAQSAYFCVSYCSQSA